MWEKIMEAGTGVNVLWGIGLLGLMLQIVLSTYINRLVKASSDMSTTRRKSLRAVRQTLDNRRTLCMDMGTGEAFAEKSVRSLKFMGIPLVNFRHMGYKLSLIVCMGLSGAFLYYDVSWRGSPDMIYFMANGVCVCAFLLILENIFLVTNKLELLKANIWDYLSSSRVVSREERTKSRDPVETEKPNIERVDADSSLDEVATGKEERPPHTSPAESEEILNSFLKEFFS